MALSAAVRGRVYIKALRCSVTCTVQVVLVTHYALKAWSGSYCGNSGQNIHSKDKGGGEELLIAGVQLTGQLVVTPPP